MGNAFATGMVRLFLGAIGPSSMVHTYNVSVSRTDRVQVSINRRLGKSFGAYACVMGYPRIRILAVWVDTETLERDEWEFGVTLDRR